MILNSDYPQLYIAKTFTASATAPVNAGGWGSPVTIKIQHDLPFKPLVRGVWSDRADFSWANDLDIDTKDDFGNYPQISLSSYYVNDSDIVINAYNNTTPAREVTFYVKVVCLVPPDYTGDIEEFDTVGVFKFSSDKKYNKLVAGGSLPASGGAVNHNLGYVPMCYVFSRGSYGAMVRDEAVITDSQLVVTPRNPGQLEGYYYFIFKDAMNGKAG